MAKAVHSMIRVLDEERSVNFYKDVFGLEVAERFEFDSFTLVYLRNAESEFELELTINKGRLDPYDLGEGYGHLAFTVEDIEAEHTRLREAGYQPRDIVELTKDDVPLARFFFVSDPDGYKIEVIQREGRYV
ncbi:lactoylglutathione lyase [Nitratireductor aestuarii]|uniref:Aldoketomutase n=1 Tax=Nitratireductor aestuarii TaxID=1735103 RepID=A0A916RFI2_9HYPH|nr:VOC family protein [Nitratireductor aestuarii]GGA52299.1 lactoylglutathione lyase [Nitratireductor aestuarii]